MKKIGRPLIGLIAFVLIVAIAVALYVGTNGFQSGLKSFALMRDGSYVYNDTTAYKVYAGDVFAVKHYDKDKDDISVKIVPVKTKEDFRFYVDGLEYSWNSNIVPYYTDFTSYFGISVDQGANTVAIKNATLSALKEFARAKLGSSGEVSFVTALPKEDMFRVEITSDDSTMVLSGWIYSKPDKLELADETLIINMKGDL